MGSLIDGARALRFFIAGAAMSAAEDSEPSDNFGVLIVVQNFELHSNWVFH